MKNKEKILKHIEKRDTIYVAIIVFIINFLLTKIDVLQSSDAIWNFQHAYKIYNGYQMYVDTNIIITPLFYYIVLALFKIFGATFATFSLYSIIINVTFFVVLYEIFKEFKIKKIYSFLLILGMFAWHLGLFFGNNANYNLLAVLWVLISILVRLKNYKKRIKYHSVIQGILLFLTLFTKQNIGAFFLIGTTFFDIIKDESKKEKIKSIIIEYCTIGFLGVIFLIYLHFSGTWEGFFFYTIQGMGEFTENFNFINVFSISSVTSIAVMLMGIIFGTVGIANNKYTKEQKENIKFLTCISITLLGTMYPIFNGYHVCLGCYVSIINTIYTIKCLLSNETYNEKRIKIFAIILIIIYWAADIMSLSGYLTLETMKINDKKHPFYGIKIERVVYQSIENIDNYILEKQTENINVIIIYEKSGLYMIPLKKNNGRFDCFCQGNLGATGANGVIDEIKEMKNTEILILKKDEDVFYQEPEEVRTYIKENLEYIGEIEQFSIYKTK